jgi:hypothetical protein
LLACCALGIAFVALYGREAPPALYALAGIGAAACALWLLALRPWAVQNPAARAGLQASLLALLLVDLWPVARSLVELRPAGRVFGEGAEATSYLAQRAFSGGHAARVYSPSYSVPHHVAARLGVEQLDGVDPLQLAWAASAIGLAGGYPQQGYSVTQPPFPPGTEVRTAWQGAKPDAIVLGALNVCAVAAAFPVESPGLALETRIGNVYLYANSHCLPRAYRVARVEPVRGGWQEAQGALRRGIDPEQQVWVEGGVALAGPAGWRPAAVQAYTPNRIVVEAEAGQPSLLILADVWAPGWRATVDGERQPVYRVNGVLRGVYLQPGRRRIVWRYRPASLYWGAALSAGAWLLCILSNRLKVGRGLLSRGRCKSLQDAGGPQAVGP